MSFSNIAWIPNLAGLNKIVNGNVWAIQHAVSRHLCKADRRALTAHSSAVLGSRLEEVNFFFGKPHCSVREGGRMAHTIWRGIQLQWMKCCECEFESPLSEVKGSAAHTGVQILKISCWCKTWITPRQLGLHFNCHWFKSEKWWKSCRESSPMDVEYKVSSF